MSHEITSGLMATEINFSAERALNKNIQHNESQPNTDVRQSTILNVSKAKKTPHWEKLSVAVKKERHSGTSYG